MYRVAQNPSKQVLGILHPKFRSLSPHFFLPWLGGAAVQILLKIGKCCVAAGIS